MSSPAPLNFSALSDAWDSPIAFARELSNYYAQLEETGHRPLTHHWTERETP